jgi:hypothetical protein
VVVLHQLEEGLPLFLVLDVVDELGDESDTLEMKNYLATTLEVT